MNSPRAEHREPEDAPPEGRIEPETGTTPRSFLIWDAVPQITGTADEDWLLS